MTRRSHTMSLYCKLLFALGILFNASQASSSTIPWSEGVYGRHSTGEDLRTVISDLAIESQFVVTVSDKVQGEVNGVFKDIDRSIFFDTLVKTHQLSYFYDGAMLWVSTYDDIETQIIRFKHISYSQFEMQVRKLGIVSSVSSWKKINESTLYLVGTGDYIEFISEFVNSVDMPQNDTSNIVYVHVNDQGISEYSDKAVSMK